MKYRIISLLLPALLTLVASCTHNRGDIGPWFGTWHVEDVTSSADPDYMASSGAQNYFLQFQSTVFSIRRVDVDHNVDATYGRWEEDGGRLTVTFPDTTLSAVEVCDGLKWIVGDAVNRYTVRAITGTDMTLETTVDGISYVITLKKWGKGL